jgi:hypothetical protein
MRSDTTDRQRRKANKVRLSTRMQPESAVSRRKQRTGGHSTRCAECKSFDLSPEAYLSNVAPTLPAFHLKVPVAPPALCCQISIPDAVPTKPALSARHSASPGRKAWVNQKERISTFCAASPAQVFSPARPSVSQLSSCHRPCLPAFVPGGREINRHKSASSSAGGLF